MLSHLEQFPAGQFPYYSGLTKCHLGWLKPVRFTATTILCEVTESDLIKKGVKLYFARASGQLIRQGSSPLRDYMLPMDFQAMDYLAPAEL